MNVIVHTQGIPWVEYRYLSRVWLPRQLGARDTLTTTWKHKATTGKRDA